MERILVDSVSEKALYLESSMERIFIDSLSERASNSSADIDLFCFRNKTAVYIRVYDWYFRVDKYSAQWCNEPDRTLYDNAIKYVSVGGEVYYWRDALDIQNPEFLFENIIVQDNVVTFKFKTGYSYATDSPKANNMAFIHFTYLTQHNVKVDLQTGKWITIIGEYEKRQAQGVQYDEVVKRIVFDRKNLGGNMFLCKG